MNPRIREVISESILVKQSVLQDARLLDIIARVVDISIIALQGKKKALFCGNGGSAADAQHIAAELSGRFYLDREPLFAEALHVNSSALTSIANDYGFEEVYARMVRAKGEKGDILFALSTSGNSPNILKAVEAAKAQSMFVVGMTGDSGGKMVDKCDYLINIPSTDTPRIQECHMMIGHLICELVEKSIFES
jgi:D-sedoheptulose 7-phosphate isomerase